MKKFAGKSLTIASGPWDDQYSWACTASQWTAAVKTVPRVTPWGLLNFFLLLLSVGKKSDPIVSKMYELEKNIYVVNPIVCTKGIEKGGENIHCKPIVSLTQRKKLRKEGNNNVTSCCRKWNQTRRGRSLLFACSDLNNGRTELFVFTRLFTKGCKKNTCWTKPGKGGRVSRRETKDDESWPLRGRWRHKGSES